MIIRVGTSSLNPNKVEAVRELLPSYPFLKDVIVEGVEVNSGVRDQPRGIDEIMQGAINRARGAYAYGGTNLGVGIESGLIEVQSSRTGILELAACVIYDGKEVYTFLTPIF